MYLSSHLHNHNFDKSFLDLLQLKVEDGYNSDKHLPLEGIFFLLSVYFLNKNLPKVVNLNQEPVLNFLNYKLNSFLVL